MAGRCRLCAQLAIDLEVEVLSWAGYGERLVHRRSRFLRVHSAYNHRRIILLAEASRPFTATWVLPRTRPAPCASLCGGYIYEPGRGILDEARDLPTSACPNDWRVSY